MAQAPLLQRAASSAGKPKPCKRAAAATSLRQGLRATSPIRADRP